MKKFLNHFIRDESGQSLMEIVVGLTIGAILIGTASFGIAFMLRSTSTNQNLSGGSQLTQGLINNAQSFADASWQNVYGLSKGSTNQYFLNASGTSYITVRGQEVVVSNDITNGLVGRWGFDETTGTIAYDATGNNNSGTLTGSPTRATSTCKIANCLSFNGGNSVNAPQVLSSSSSFTAVAWVNPSDTTTAWKTVFAEGCTGFDLTINAATIYFGRNCGAGNGFYTGPAVSADTWYHLAIVFNGANLDLYKNGVKTTGGASTYSHAALYIGSYNGANELFKGSIDDVRVYNRALSGSEITQLYNSQPFTRYFYVENVCRTNDSSGSVSTTTSPCPGGTVDDPLTQKITAFTNWLAGASTDQVSLARYVTRWGNFIVRQTDWSGSSGQEGPLTAPNSSYSSSSNVTGTSTLGSFKLQNLTQQ